jgi:RNA polymerase sigma factor (sigma-70 family)
MMSEIQESFNSGEERRERSIPSIPRGLKRALKPEEERELAIRAKEGDEMARENLISSLQPLVISIANGICEKYGCWGEYDDLLGEGNEAAIKAVDEFDPDRGARLPTFAYPKIKGAMMNYLIKEWCRGVHASNPLLRLAFRVKKAHDEIMMMKKGGKPTPEEIAQYLSVTVKQVEEALNLLIAIDIKSLDEIRREAEEEGHEWEPTSEEPSPEEELIQEEEKQAEKEALERLDREDREILMMKYWEDLSYEEIAEELGITVKAVKSRLYRARERFLKEFGEITGAKSPQKKRRR